MNDECQKGDSSGTASSLSNDLKESDELTDISKKLLDDDNSLTGSITSQGDFTADILRKIDSLGGDGIDTDYVETEYEAEEEWIDLLGSGGILKKILLEGKPDSRPTRLDYCRIKYFCTLEDGSLVEKHDDFELQLGDCEVVQGLDLALGLMNVGEICKLKIESRLAYGNKGLKPFVKSDSTVLYDVELLSVEPDTDIETLTIAQRKLKGNKKRERGNWWYCRGENTLAIQCYRRALDFLDEVEGGITDPLPEGQSDVTDTALQDLLQDRVSVCNNMAAAQIKLGHHDAALTSLQTVLRCQPDNIKALYRKSKVLTFKNDLNAALKCLQKASEISPDNADVQKEVLLLQTLIRKQKVTERELARRMLNGSNTTSPRGASKKRNSASKLFVWATLGASIAVGLVGLAAYRLKFM